MTSMSVSMSDALRSWVDQRVQEMGYGSASDYLADLVRRDREDSEQRAAIVAELERGEASGLSPRSVPDILDALLDEAARAR